MPTAEPQPIAVAIVVHDDRVLIGPRGPKGPLAGLWEFPGGKIHSGETPAEAAKRECLEETGLAIRVLALTSEVDHRYVHGEVKIFFFAAEPENPLAWPQAPFTWVPIAALPAYAFPPANAEVIARLLRGS